MEDTWKTICEKLSRKQFLSENGFTIFTREYQTRRPSRVYSWPTDIHLLSEGMPTLIDYGQICLQADDMSNKCNRYLED